MFGRESTAIRKKIVYGLGAIWAALFLISFISLQTTEPTGDGFTRGLNRVTSFMTWQVAAFVFAVGAALGAYRAEGCGKHFKLIGYGPLLASVILLALLVAIIAFRLYVQPQFG